MTKKWTGERLETFVYNETTIEHLHRYAIAMNYTAGKNVLDIACGEGYGANLLAQNAKSVTGIDIDPGTITSATKKYTQNNLRFVAGRVEDIPVADNTFDTIVSFETLEHTREHEKMFKEIRRVLKPGGLLIISTPEKKYYTDLPGGNNPYHLKELYEHEFIDLIKRFFAYNHCFYQALSLSSLAVLKKESKLAIYEGSYDAIKLKNTIEPTYLIAIASDNEIEAPASSIFIDKSITATLLKEKENEVRNTLSYRVGHFLLWPLKLIRKIFKS